MKYKTKSAIIGRKKKLNENSLVRPIFISLFNKNNPQHSKEAPTKILEFNVKEVKIKNLNLSYLPHGNDLIINNLSNISVSKNKKIILLTGKQSR